MQLNFEQLFIENIFQTLSNRPKKSVLLHPQKKVGRSPIALSILNTEYQIIKIINKQNNNTKMKREFTKLMAALVLLVGLTIPMGMWGQTTVASFSRSGSTNNTTGGTFSTTFSAKDGFYQDNNGDCYMRILNTSAYWTTTPTSISFTASIGGGSGNTDLTNPVYVALLDAEGTVIEGTQTNVTSHITNAGGDSYNISIPVTNNVYGVTLSHVKQNGYNVRYFSFTLSYVADGGQQPTTYTVTVNQSTGGTISATPTSAAAGTTITLTATPAEGYSFDSWSITPNTVEINNNQFTMPASDVTVSAQWTENTTPGGDEQWVLTNLADLTTNDVFVIVGTKDAANYAMSNDKGASAAPTAVSVTVANDQITSNVACTIQWTGITGNATDGYTIYSNADNTKYLYCISNNNGVRVGTGDNKTFIIKDNYIYNNGQRRYLGVYNSSDWRSYTSINNNIVSQTFAFYKKVTGGVLPPSITAEDVNIPYDATSGSITYTITNGVEGGALTASTESDWLILGQVGETVPFTCATNQASTERTATVTLTYTYNSETTTQNVTVTQTGNPNAVDNISDITGSSQTHAVRGTVVGVNSRGFVLGDGTGYVYIYLNAAPGVSVGDIRKVSGTTGSYNHVIQYTSSASIEAATTSNYNNTPAVQVLDAEGIAAYSDGLHLSDYVQIQGLLVHSGNYYNITVEGVSSTASISYPNNDQQTLLNSLDNKQVIVKGYFAGVSNDHFNVILESIEEVIADVEAPTFSPAAGTYTETQTVAISCATANSTIYYTLDGTEPTNSSTQYTGALTISATTTVKAIAYVGTNNSMVATATYHFCSAEDPYTVTEALAFNEYPANGIYVTGIVSTAPTQAPSNGQLTYYISVDGEATNQLEVYKGKGLNEEAFTAQTDIQVGDIVTVYGNVVIYGTTNPIKEFASGNYLVSFERPVAPAQEYTLTVGNPAHVTFTVGYGTDGVLTNGENDDIEEGTEITLTVNVEAGYLLDGITVTGANSQSVTVTETSTQGVYTFNMPAFNATISATTIVAPATTTYTLATSIESGKQYIIVGQADNVYYAMGNDKGNNRYAYEIALDGTTATATVASGNNVHEFTITSLATPGFYSICDAITPGYLYAASSSSNNLKTEETLDENHNGDWEISINSETGVASIVASNSSYTRNVMQFNNSSILFACYGSASQHPVYLYVKNETVSYSLDITAYTGDKDHYYLIASPVQSVTPSADNGFLTSAYDLYRFDQVGDAEGNEWLNYEVTPFNLISGQGYLYASSTDTKLEFEGAPYMGNGQVTLYKKNCSNASGNFEGWNLVGNPFAQIAYIDRDCYVMNENRNQIVAGTSRQVAAMEGVFVIAARDEETMTFSTTPLGKADSKVVMNVIDNQGVADRAIVRFGEGSQLPKFQLKGNSTKVYFQQGQEEFAIVAAENEGELPVNFKASRNGRYTMSFDVENLDMNYLHLIDNKTGNDVDLLATPSYTFQANSSDYESRFRLVFDANNENGASTDSATFAYFNGSEWVINNPSTGSGGNATLQVIDMMGRVLSSQTLNGNANVNINQPAGIYMLRLVNGENVMVQKVVVR